MNLFRRMAHLTEYVRVDGRGYDYKVAIGKPWQKWRARRGAGMAVWRPDPLRRGS